MNSDIDSFRKTPDGKVIQGASHTCRVLNHKSRNAAIIKAVCDLRKIKDDFDSIVCCGISGLMVAPTVAELLDKHIVVIRKQKDDCYSEFPMEGVTPFRYVILDDLICSGNTVKHIKNTIHEDSPRARCIGLYCYIPEECAYTADTANLFKNRFGIPLLNPCRTTT